MVALIVVVAGAESPPSASEALARAKRFVPLDFANPPAATIPLS